MSTPVRVSRHRRRRPDRLRPALPHRLRPAAGPRHPVHLKLLEIPDAVKAAEGTAMELDDCAFPLLAGIDIHDDAKQAFDGVNIALLVGARPAHQGHGARRPAGGQRRHLQAPGRGDQRGRRRRPQGARGRQPGQHQRADRPEQRRRRARRALHGDDAPGPEPRDAQLAKKPGAPVADIKNLAVWGNHSPSMFPDLFNAKVGGKNAFEAVAATRPGTPTTIIPTVGKRGAAIIEARGASSAASAANAAIDHVHDWVIGTAEGDWVSMAVPSTAPTTCDEGIISSFPVTCSGGEYSIVRGPRASTRPRARTSTRPRRSSSTSATRSRSSTWWARGTCCVQRRYSPAGCQPLPFFSTLPSLCSVGITRYR